jgi:hypothetical protein
VQNADFICAKRRIFKKEEALTVGNVVAACGKITKKATKNEGKCPEISVSIFLHIIEVFFANTLEKNALLCYNSTK